MKIDLPTSDAMPAPTNWTAAFAKAWDDVRSLCPIIEEARDEADALRRLYYREAGGTAVFQSAPFERALRDVHTMGGHVVFQRAMMEDAGRVELGLSPQLGMF